MTDDLVKRLRRDLASGLSASIGDTKDAADRIEELERAVDLRRDCDQRAIKKWQEAHPDNDGTWPDHADMCVWLIRRVENLDRHVELRDWFLVENDLWERFAKSAEGKKDD